jgi:hypothetical protein
MICVPLVVDLRTLLFVVVVRVSLLVVLGTITLVGSLVFLSSANNPPLVLVVTDTECCSHKGRAERCTARKSFGLSNSGSVVPQHGTQLVFLQ